MSVTIPAEEYLSDHRSLSSSGARKLLPPYAPAIFKHERDHGRPGKKEFDFGHAAHKVVLSDVGSVLEVVDAADWRTKDARDKREAARQEGRIPLLVSEFEVVEAMAAAIADHPIARDLFDPDHGKPEQSLYWTDAETGVACRARLDWLPNKRDGERMVIPDYKSAWSAHPEKFRKSAAEYGYHQQAAWYLDGVKANGLDDDPGFIFVVQEKNPPYLVTVVELGEVSLHVGRQLNHQARTIYAECLRTNKWPGYSEGIELVDLPEWYLAQHDEEEELVIG